MNDDVCIRVGPDLLHDRVRASRRIGWASRARGVLEAMESPRKSRMPLYSLHHSCIQWVMVRGNGAKIESYDYDLDVVVVLVDISALLLS